VNAVAWERLHEVRLRGQVVGPADDAAVALIDAGYARMNGTACRITAEGRAAHAAWARLTPGSEEEAAAGRAYQRFCELDRELKTLVTAWQTAPGPAEEWAAIQKLEDFDGRAAAMLGRLARAVPRFTGYAPRLRAAREHVEAGRRQWFSGVTCDSYHTVWWQLHEDLLIALGIERAETSP
jgi:hypothetical protein